MGICSYHFTNKKTKKKQRGGGLHPYKGHNGLDHLGVRDHTYIYYYLSKNESASFNTSMPSIKSNTLVVVNNEENEIVFVFDFQLILPISQQMIKICHIHDNWLGIVVIITYFHSVICGMKSYTIGEDCKDVKGIKSNVQSYCTAAKYITFKIPENQQFTLTSLGGQNTGGVLKEKLTIRNSPSQYKTKGFKIYYEGLKDKICLKIDSYAVKNRLLNDSASIKAHKEALRKGKMPPYLKCTWKNKKTSVIIPLTYEKAFEKLVKKEKISGQEDVTKDIKKSLTLTASSSEISDKERDTMKSSTATLAEKIEICEKRMRSKFKNFEDSQHIQWQVDGINFVDGRIDNAQLICQAELNTSAKVNEEEYKEMLEKPAEFEGFDESISLIELEQKIITKDPFKNKMNKKLFYVKIGSDGEKQDCRSIVARREKSKIKSKPEVKPDSVSWLQYLKNLFKKKSSSDSYTYIIYYVYYEVAKPEDNEQKTGVNLDAVDRSIIENVSPKNTAKK
ncbi:hypothetical protein SNEBB_008344 [Seison nebaliae]|nr:hypothetical protein SNEBB_008344 [Seison nebaliae]